MAGIPKSIDPIKVKTLSGKKIPVYFFVKYNIKNTKRLKIPLKSKYLKAFLVREAKIKVINKITIEKAKNTYFKISIKSPYK